MKENLRKATSDAAFLIEVARLVSSRPKIPSVKETKQGVRDLTREQGSSGKKMVKAGTVLLAFPEPITGIAGVPILLVGAALQKRCSANLKDIYRERNKLITSLASESFYF